MSGWGGRNVSVMHKCFTDFSTIRATEKEEGHKTKICVHESFVSAVPDIHALGVA